MHPLYVLEHVVAKQVLKLRFYGKNKYKNNKVYTIIPSQLRTTCWCLDQKMASEFCMYKSYVDKKRDESVGHRITLLGLNVWCGMFGNT